MDDKKELESIKPNDQTEQVGYCKTPKDTRFRKGVSGNPKGRPRRRFDLVAIFQRTLREKVTINENGRRKSISKLEAAMKQQVNKAASGDQQALKLLGAIVQFINNLGVEAPVQEHNFKEADRKIIQRIVERFKPQNEAE